MSEMNCQDARDLLDQQDRLDLGGMPDALREHLLGCTDCDAVLGRLRLLRARLRDLPIARAPEGIADRIAQRLEPAPSGRVVRSAVPLALAAGIALCVGVAWMMSPRPGSMSGDPEAASIAVDEHAYPVRLVFSSPRALNGVSLTVVLPDGVRLAEQPGVRELSWTTDLKAGANVLELPVVAGRPAGPVVATLRYGNAERHYEIAVERKHRQSGVPPSRDVVSLGLLAALRLADA